MWKILVEGSDDEREERERERDPLSPSLQRPNTPILIFAQ